jgi:hypothetical protein
MSKRQPIAQATAAVVPLTAKKSKTQSPGRDDAPPVQLATPGRSTVYRSTPGCIPSAGPFVQKIGRITEGGE